MKWTKRRDILSAPMISCLQRVRQRQTTVRTITEAVVAKVSRQGISYTQKVNAADS